MAAEGDTREEDDTLPPEHGSASECERGETSEEFPLRENLRPRFAIFSVMLLLSYILHPN